MKQKLTLLATIAIVLMGCTVKPAGLQINGTWRLITGTVITKGDSVVTDYTKGQNMIKIVNENHFAFLHHAVGEPKDSSNQFDGGGGRYTLVGDKYTEYLDYYSDKNWEGKSFDFTVTINNDTLTQHGLEKVENENVNRIIIEKYIKEK